MMIDFVYSELLELYICILLWRFVNFQYLELKLGNIIYVEMGEVVGIY